MFWCPYVSPADPAGSSFVIVLLMLYDSEELRRLWQDERRAIGWVGLETEQIPKAVRNPDNMFDMQPDAHIRLSQPLSAEEDTRRQHVHEQNQRARADRAESKQRHREAVETSQALQREALPHAEKRMRRASLAAIRAAALSEWLSDSNSD